MKYKQQYIDLLLKNNSANNLLVLNLLQSQENYSKVQALTWIFQELIPSFKSLQQERSFYFGETGLSFIFHHAILKDSAFISKASASDTEHLYKAVLISRLLNQKESKLLHKIDYLEDDSNLLVKYKEYLLDHLEQILCNFIAEMD